MIRNRFFLSAAGAIAAAGVVAGLISAEESHSQEPPRTAIEYIDSIRGTLPAEQAPPLADGIVTFDEQEEAIRQTVSCMQKAGLVVQARPAEGLRRTTFGVRNDLIGLPDEEIKRIGDTCWAEHLSEVNFVWARQMPSSDTQARAQAQLVDCLTQSGHPLPSVSTGDNAVARLLSSGLDDAASQAVHHCLDDVEVTYGFVP